MSPARPPDSRLLVVDPSTRKVVWSYTGAGSSRLSFPDGLDDVPA